MLKLDFIGRCPGGFRSLTNFWSSQESSSWVDEGSRGNSCRHTGFELFIFHPDGAVKWAFGYVDLEMSWLR